MNERKRIVKQRQRRTFRVRNRLTGKGSKPRVSVFRSLKHISAQIIDDVAQKTVVSFSSRQLSDVAGDKKEYAKHVGLALGKLAQEHNIEEVLFDRGRYLYHGRVKALADGLRESGLKF